jgi:hypothetical protein
VTTRSVRFREQDGWLAKVWWLCVRAQPIIIVGVAVLAVFTEIGWKWTLSPWSLDEKIRNEAVASAARDDAIKATIQALADETTRRFLLADQDRASITTRLDTMIDRLDILVDVGCGKLTPDELRIAKRKLSCLGTKP